VTVLSFNLLHSQTFLGESSQYVENNRIGTGRYTKHEIESDNGTSITTYVSENIIYVFNEFSFLPDCEYYTVLILDSVTQKKFTAYHDSLCNKINNNEWITTVAGRYGTIKLKSVSDKGYEYIIMFNDYWQHREVINAEGNGDLAFDKGEYEDALMHYNIAIEGWGPNAYTYFFMGMCHFYLENYGEAIGKYTLALENDPDSIIGNWASLNGRGCAIKGYWSILVSARFSVYDTYIYRGIAKNEQGDIRGAIRDLSTYVDHIRTNGFVYFKLGTLRAQLGTSLNDRELLTAANQDLTRAIMLDSSYASSYINRGLTYILLGKLDEGCMDFSRAGELGDTEAYGYIKEYCK
jgi:tetratricopeptide (TPR) repeat protein